MAFLEYVVESFESIISYTECKWYFYHYSPQLLEHVRKFYFASKSILHNVIDILAKKTNEAELNGVCS